ncbi:MAG TPA: molybdopterin cofactor-binding domain-containing protein [Conexibacter sp.]|jgi:CO/xanthine dehydrogenase Mo-binding subunit
MPVEPRSAGALSAASESQNSAHRANGTTPTRGGVSRRGFLGGTGALVVSVMAPRALGGPAPAEARSFARKRPFMPPPEGPDVFAVDSWLSVRGDGRITVFTGKTELGTGTATMTLQLAGDELGVDIDQLDIVEPDTARTVDQIYTAGSQTTKSQWNEGGLRMACAEARAFLFGMASRKLNKPASQLVVNNGVVGVKGATSGPTVSYADLIGDRRFEIRVSPRVTVRTPDEYTLIGHSIPRIDIPGKINGTFMYVQDIVLPGMLHGRIIRQPVPDARLISVDTDASKHPGVVKIVTMANRVGVVAHTEQQAINAMASIRPKWHIPPMPNQADLFRAMTSSAADTKRVLVETLIDGGGVEQAIGRAHKTIAAEYHYPHQLHGTLGADCAVADVRPDRVTVWSPTQGVYPLRDAIATLLRMRPEQVRLTYVEGSGCYGLNGADSVSIDAAIMSHAVGRPVRMQYMRADAHTQENYGQAMVIRSRAGIDEDGRIVGWDTTTYTANRGARPGPPGNVVAGGAAGFPAAPNPPSPPPEPPLGPDSSNAVTQYDLPHNRVISYTVPSRVYTGQLRSPQRLQNTFANESFMDEMAHLAGEDPVAFRLKHLSDPRLIDVLKAATRRARWQPRVANTGSHRQGGLLAGRGVAAVQYEGTEAYAGVVLDLTVDPSSGAVQVKRVWAAQDCGTTINPNGMEAQAQGCVIQGISRALKEQLRWNADSIESVDWVSYPVATFSDMPDSFDFQIIDRPGVAAVGAGEVVITPMVAAIANGIFDATGARMREVPFTPDNVMAALRAA